MFLCHWHAKRAWLKNLIKKCGRGVLTDLFDDLGQVMVMLKLHEEDDASFLSRAQQRMEAVYQRFAEQTAFVEYFKRTWGTDEKLSESLKMCPAIFACMQM